MVLERDAMVLLLGCAGIAGMGEVVRGAVRNKVDEK